jgi:superfamily II DNA or RNA helicase
MAVAQCRVCALCGKEMTGPIEADHIVPFSLGGETTISNGQATCASCNRKKSNTMQDIYIPKSFKLRSWQQDCLSLFRETLFEEVKSFCLHATPGAGKTKWAACAFKTAQLMDVANKLLWIVPSRNLKQDIGDHDRSRDLWAEGITAVYDIENALVEEAIAMGRCVWPQDKDAWLVTYGQIASNPHLFAALCRNFRVMAVLDEVHHVQEGKQWGKAVRNAVEQAKVIVPMSGTLFTSSGDGIPFVNYDDRIGDDGKTYRRYRPHYSFGMKQALQRQPGEHTPSIRPLTYIKVNAEGRFTYRNLNEDTTFERIIDLKEDGAKLTPLLSPRSEMVRVMIKAGIESLDGYRNIEGDKTAGGLIVCMNEQHAHAIADVMRSEFGEDPLVVLHNTPEASTAIDQFRRGNSRWIITVRMVSEGVDIRRLRVGVYLTNYVTYLFLVQWLGRMWRWNPALGAAQQGTAIIPAQNKIVEWVSELEKETYESIVDECGDAEPNEEQGGKKPSEFILEESDTTASLDGGQVHSIPFGGDSYAEAQSLFLQSDGQIPTGVIAAVLELRVRKATAAVSSIAENDKRESNLLRLGQLIGAIKQAMVKNPPEDWDGGNPYQYINGKLNRAAGIKSFSEKMATDEDVAARKESARQLLGLIKGV